MQIATRRLRKIDDDGRNGFLSRNVAAGGDPATVEREIEPSDGSEPCWEEITRFLDRYGTAIRGTARRFSSSSEDAEDAYQRAVEILIRHAPKMRGRINPAWMHTVVRHEALRLGKLRQRSGLVTDPGAGEAEFETGGFSRERDNERTDPAQIVEMQDEFGRFRQAFKRLKRSEQRALCLIGEGYSYEEIAEITGWSRTKINRHLSEGRARMRNMLERIESGHRCAELAGRLSRYCDGEATPDEVAEVRDHLEQCLACRSTLHRYRVVPRRAAALFPALPAAPSLGERMQELSAWIQTRLPGRSGLGEAALIATGNGTGARGNGMAALAKLAIVCVGATGGTAACVASGVLPAPSLGAIERALGAGQQSEPVKEAEEPATPELAVETPPADSDALGETPGHEEAERPNHDEVAGADPHRPTPEPTPSETEFGPEGGGEQVIPQTQASPSPPPATSSPSPAPAADSLPPVSSGGGEFTP